MTKKCVTKSRKYCRKTINSASILVTALREKIKDFCPRCSESKVMRALINSKLEDKKLFDDAVEAAAEYIKKYPKC